jgi:hypothetical protein
MLMISLDHNTHTYICTTARSATQLPRAVTGINGNMALIKLGFLHTLKNFYENYP